MPPTKAPGQDPLQPYLPDLAAYDQALQSAAYEYVKAAVQHGARTGAAELSIAPGFDVLNPDTIAFIEKYAGLMANTVNRTMVEKIRGALTVGLQEGESYRDMRDRVLEAMGCTRDEETGKIIADKGATYRAEMIARTETDRAENAGRQAQLQEAGAVRKIWRANPGACEFCQAVDGMTVGTEEHFFKRGDNISLEQPGSEEESPTVHSMNLDYSDTPYPPLHPNCLCVVEYEFD